MPVNIKRYPDGSIDLDPEEGMLVHRGPGISFVPYNRANPDSDFIRDVFVNAAAFTGNACKFMDNGMIALKTDAVPEVILVAPRDYGRVLQRDASAYIPRVADYGLPVGALRLPTQKEMSELRRLKEIFGINAGEDYLTSDPVRREWGDRDEEEQDHAGRYGLLLPVCDVSSFGTYANGRSPICR